MYQQLIRPFLFLFDAEKVHHFIFAWIKIGLALPWARGIARRLFDFQDERLVQDLMGLRFPNPVGLAAGFDKDATLIDELACFGFGFIEIGTLTPKPQPGNPRPRLFRLPADRALINRLGFNNGGVATAAARLSKRQSKVIVGGNIGKNKDTPNENAIADYTSAFETLFDHVDYFVVNVSSPNTPGLRELQDKGPLLALLQALQVCNRERNKPKPLLLKIAPDLTDSQLDDIVEISQLVGLSGLIATNTTINRSGLATDQTVLANIGAGGLSGQPLRARSTEVIRYLRQRLAKDFVIIGVGGIYTAADALEKLAAGASLVQLYTGFVYEGPEAIKRINQGIGQSWPSKKE